MSRYFTKIYIQISLLAKVRRSKFLGNCSFEQLLTANHQTISDKTHEKGSYMCLQFALEIYAMLDDFVVKAFDMLCGNSTLSKYFEYQQSP